MINAIRVAEESYRAETGAYANISNNVSITNAAGTGCTAAASMYPNAAPGAFKNGWGATCAAAQCPTAGLDWTSIPLHVDGPVMYGYSVSAGPTGAVSPTTFQMIGKNGNYTLTPGAQPTDWFMVGACGDPDGDGIFSAYLGASFTNEVYESNEGN
jgi:hypothetical protein